MTKKYILAISPNGHDSSICLMEDNEVVLLYPCERHSREKHTSKIYPSDLLPIKRFTSHVDLLVIVNCSNDFAKNKIVPMLQNMGITYNSIHGGNFETHHYFHAAASFYSLDIDEANCIVIDGSGQTFPFNVKNKKAVVAETTSYFYATREQIKPLYKHFQYRPIINPMDSAAPGSRDNDIRELAKKSFPFPTTISHHLDVGKMYGTVSRFIGYNPMDAGKTMGLSAYGSPEGIPPMLIEDGIVSNANLFRNDSTIDTVSYPHLYEPSEQIKRNMAFCVQRALEKIFVYRVHDILKYNNSNNLILSGGCALNVIGNSIIKKTFPNLNVYSEPIGTDAAQSIGAAYALHQKMFPGRQIKPLSNIYLGVKYDAEVVKDSIYKLVEQYNNESNLQSNISQQ